MLTTIKVKTMNDLEMQTLYNKFKKDYDNGQPYNGIKFWEIEQAFTCFVWHKYFYTDNIKLARLFHKNGFKISRCGREYWEVKNV